MTPFLALCMYAEELTKVFILLYQAPYKLSYLLIPLCWFEWKLPHRIMYLNDWASQSGTTWEGLGTIALLEQVCPC